MDRDLSRLRPLGDTCAAQSGRKPLPSIRTKSSKRIRTIPLHSPKVSNSTRARCGRAPASTGPAPFAKWIWRPERCSRIILLSTLYFGEGITFFGDRLYPAHLSQRHRLRVRSQNLQANRVVPLFRRRLGADPRLQAPDHDDGSSALRFLDPRRSAKIAGWWYARACVRSPNLNELELIEGEIWANIWTQGNCGAHRSPQRAGEFLGGFQRSPAGSRLRRGLRRAERDRLRRARASVFS